VESVDHADDVRSLVLPEDGELHAVWKTDLLGGVMALSGQAWRNTTGGAEPLELVAIPNYARLNRGGRSRVWIAEDPEVSVQWLEPKAGVYRIAALHTKKPWGVADASKDEGAVVRQEPKSDDRSQLWQIEKVAPAYYKIVNVHSGKALTVSDGKRGNNTLMRQTDYDGQDHQQFAFERREGGVIVMVARHSGRSICVQGARREDGAPIHQYDYVGVLDQHVELTKVE
jgi:ricin-type beta-trefoil lectin protein